MSEYEKIIIPLEYDPAIAFVVKERDNSWRGYVYAVMRWTKGEENGYEYFSEQGGATDDEGQARCSFQFTLVCRGTADGCIWFTQDEEYDDADFLIMHRQWRYLRMELLRRMKADGCEMLDEDFIDELKPDRLIPQ